MVGFKHLPNSRCLNRAELNNIEHGLDIVLIRRRTDIVQSASMFNCKTLLRRSPYQVERP